MERADFERLIAGHSGHSSQPATLAPVTRIIDYRPPGGTLPRALRRGDAGFVLSSSPETHGGWEPGRVTLLGLEPRATWRAWGHRVELTEAGRTVTSEVENPLTTLEPYLGRRPRLAGVPGLPRFSGGFVGYLGWGAVRWFEPRVPARLGADPSFPDAELMLFDELAAVDRGRGTAILVVNVDPSRHADTTAAFAHATERLDRLEASLADAGAEDGVGTGDESRGPRLERDGWPAASFGAAVQSVLGHLRAGDCMQTVLSRRVTAQYDGAATALYSRLADASPAPYQFLIQLRAADGVRRAVVGASPELLVKVDAGEVTVRPIAGTRRRGATPDEDAALERELRADPKERAEHVMLVDLGRNDVGRVARPGSVRVEEREVVERFSHVMHLVSQVSGTLREGLSPLAALAAAFPAGTVSGAPKVRALEIIDALEPVPRGPYGGAVGSIGYDGSIVMAIHLRSLALAGDELRLQAGAGIVADSEALREHAETEAKLAGVRAALGLAGVDARERWRRW